MVSPQPGFLDEPAAGRVFATRRIVRSTDVTMSGRLRLDALARYLQSAAEDDVADAGLTEPVVWLLRRCELTIGALPLMGDRLSVRTFCSGTGPRWAERTTTLSGAGGPLLQARALWAAVSQDDGRPVQLSEKFMNMYRNAAAGRTVSARLLLPRPDATSDGKPWPLRTADFDTAGHVNNAVHWAVVEDLLAATGSLPAVAEMEYHRPILPGSSPQVVTGSAGPAAAMLWLVAEHRVLAAARLTE
jgi:acyl-ACP thioesterase